MEGDDVDTEVEGDKRLLSRWPAQPDDFAPSVDTKEAHRRIRRAKPIGGESETRQGVLCIV